MTREETKEAIRVMQAFVDGKRIKQKGPSIDYGITDDPEWNFEKFIYTVIEKQPTHRPFKNAEEFKPYRDKYFKYKNYDFSSYVKAFSYNEIGIKTINGACYEWKDLFDECVFEDGSPCGISLE